MDELQKILGCRVRTAKTGSASREGESFVASSLLGWARAQSCPSRASWLLGVGHLKLTGACGEVIKESTELALSWVKTHSYDLEIMNKRALDPLRILDAMIDMHLHLPAGAQKKDRPSAGVAMVRTQISFPSDLGSQPDIG